MYRLSQKDGVFSVLEKCEVDIEMILCKIRCLSAEYRMAGVFVHHQRWLIINSDS